MILLKFLIYFVFYMSHWPKENCLFLSHIEFLKNSSIYLSCSYSIFICMLWFTKLFYHGFTKYNVPTARVKLGFLELQYWPGYLSIWLFVKWVMNLISILSSFHSWHIHGLYLPMFLPNEASHHRFRKYFLIASSANMAWLSTQTNGFRPNVSRW